MFVGDRGTGVGSRIKDHQRYGGRWLEELRGKRGVVCIANKHNISQTCLYCFEKLEHPCQLVTKQGKVKEKKISGVLLCVNPACVSVKYGQSTKARDSLSALAIGLSGASTCFLGETMPCFSPYKISQLATENFDIIATSFLKGKAVLPVA
ncbi:hypothetical protein EDC94DRAFT_514982 [Helicostylum pulchrum]|nr:hypothetical protein EDC94DRAFT_514982 [Helicostylum pulchrum]